jgi:hypothetical protein
MEALCGMLVQGVACQEPPGRFLAVKITFLACCEYVGQEAQVCGCYA